MKETTSVKKSTNTIGATSAIAANTADTRTELVIAPDAPVLPTKPFQFVMSFLKHYRMALWAMLILETSQAACQILIPYSIKEIIDLGSHSLQLAGTPSLQVAESSLSFLSSQTVAILLHMKPALVLFVGLSLGILIFSRASGSLLVLVGPSLRRRVRFTIFKYLQYHSQKYFTNNFAGSLANRISEVSMSVGHSLWTVLFDFWPVLVTFSASLILMYKVHSVLALVLGGWTLAYILVSFFLARKCQVYSRRYAATRSTVSGKVVDSVTNAMNTKVFARLDYERGYLKNYLDKEVTEARRTMWFTEAMRWFQFLSTMSLQVAIIVLSAFYWMKQGISTGSFAMVTSLSLLVINDAQGLSRRFLEFFEYLGNINDGVDIIVRSHEVVDRAQAPDIKISKGEIEFRNVQFSYSEGRDVFQDMNVKILPGERVGLVGFSGSGKTTFVNLILRMYDLNSGSILIDGQDVALHTQDSLREQIAMIPQDPMLFHRTLMENIRYARLDATDADVIEAAQMAHAHEFIQNIPEKYEALVGERGIKLSGGQRQRIAIARAILKNAPILLMDEATSSLDSSTERTIQGSLDTLMCEKTVVVIAHRLSTIAHLNRILVFDNGRIIEDGSHEELLKKNGRYANLWNMQVGGFLPDSQNSSLFEGRVGHV